MSQPRVTAILPLHNHAKWVGDAVSSIDRQDYPNKQIIVVDDGSTDGGHEVVLRELINRQKAVINGLVGDPEAYVGKHRNCRTDIVLIRYKNASGPSFARNRGMELGFSMGSELFAFLDSDDVYLPGKIAKSVNVFVKNPQVGAVYSDYNTINPDGLLMREYKEPFSRKRLFRECLPNCDSLVSVDAIKSCDGFDEQMRTCEDYDLWMRISEKYLIYHLPEALVKIRVGPHSSSATVPSATWQKNYARVFEKVQERAGQRPVG